MALASDPINDLIRQAASYYINNPSSGSSSSAGTTITVTNPGTTITFTNSSIQVSNFPGTISLLNDISSGNSSTVALGANATFTGTTDSTLLYNSVSVMVSASHDSATDGLMIEQSTDGVNFDRADYVDILAGEPMAFTVNVKAEYFRVSYTNAATTQTTFRLETRRSSQFHPLANSWRSNAPSKFALLAATVTANTAIISAPGTSKSLLIRTIDVFNESTVPMNISIKNGTTTLYQAPLAASGGGFLKQFSAPARIAKNTALNAALATAGNTVYVNAEYVVIRG